MGAQFEQWQRVRVRDAHSLRGALVSLGDGYIVWVRFDRQLDEASYPYHVEDLEREDDPCGCGFCEPST
jgi:hypothetical protein